MARAVPHYILYCVKCGAPSAANLIIQKNGNYPEMGIEIECNCRGKNKKVVYYLGHLQEIIQKNFNIVEKA